MVGQAVEQGVDGRETVELVFGQLFEHSGHIARIGDQDVAAAHPHAQHHVAVKTEDVVQRQGADGDDLFTRRHLFERRLVPGFGLDHVGHQVAVQQHSTLRHTGGATGVLQHSDVVECQRHRLEAAFGTARNRVVELDRFGQAVGGHHLLDVAHHVVHQRTLEQPELVTHGTHHHVFDGGVGQHLLQRVGKVLDDDDGFGARVLELVLQLTRGVQRVDVHHHITGPQNGSHRHRVLRHVGQHDRNAVAFGQAQALQVHTHRAAQAVGLGVGDLLAHEAVGHALGVFLEALFHQRHE